MPCLFQSATQKEELPRFVLEDSTLHNTGSTPPRSAADIPPFKPKPDAFIGFSAHFSSSPLPKKEFRTSQAFDTKLHLSRCPLALCPVTR